MRIIGGHLRGSPLTAPKGLGTRPTTDRTRESLFNILSNQIDFGGIFVADMFAGTGALGLESISRGASACVFVENSRSGLQALKQNIDRLDVSSCARILKLDATKPGKLDGQEQCNLIFADPPYGKKFGERTAAALLSGNWFKPGGMFVLEESKSSLPEELTGFERIDRREYGDTSIGLFKLSQ